MVTADVHPADNLPQITEAIKPVLGDAYCYDSTVRPSKSSREILLLADQRASCLYILISRLMAADRIRSVALVHSVHVH